jgi:hypothetical protein
MANKQYYYQHEYIKDSDKLLFNDNKNDVNNLYLHEQYKENVHNFVKTTFTIDIFFQLFIFFISIINIPLMCAALITLSQWNQEQDILLKYTLLMYGVLMPFKICIFYNIIKENGMTSIHNNAMEIIVDYIIIITIVIIIIAYLKNPSNTLISEFSCMIFIIHFLLLLVYIILYLLIKYFQGMTIYCLPILVTLPNTCRESGVSQYELHEYPTTVYDPFSYYKTDSQCPICLTQYNNFDKLIIFNCQHDFHKDCIKNWLYVDASCPLCLKNIIINQKVEV